MRHVTLLPEWPQLKLTGEIQEWLGKYGTARVKLNVDKDFSLKDSSLEMLYPIYDTPTNMLFTQGAIHRTDDRTQSNIGFGWRHFQEMTGWRGEHLYRP